LIKLLLRIFFGLLVCASRDEYRTDRQFVQIEDRWLLAPSFVGRTRGALSEEQIANSRRNTRDLYLRLDTLWFVRKRSCLPPGERHSICYTAAAPYMFKMMVSGSVSHEQEPSAN
jgi:hypothetical protein